VFRLGPETQTPARWASRGENERGSALMAVVGVMGVIMIVAVTVTSITLQSLEFTTSTRAGVQSQAAADAGVAVALARVSGSGGCVATGGVFRSAVEPVFEAVVWRETAPGTWAKGCPAADQRMRILSAGESTSSQVGGQSRGGKSTVEAIFAAAGSVGAPTTGGSAVYLGSPGSSTYLNAFSATPALAGGRSDIRVATGDYSCSTTGEILGDLIVAAGNVNLTNTCAVRGNVFASGTVTMSSSAKVYGDVTASGGGVTMANSTNLVTGKIRANGLVKIQGVVTGNVETTGAATISSGGRVTSNVIAGGQVSFDGDGKTSGNVITASTAVISIPPGSATNRTVGGSVKAAGGVYTWGEPWNVPSASSSEEERRIYHLTTTTGTVGGTIQLHQSGITPPAAPEVRTVSPWVDFTYDHSKWVGYDQLAWPHAQGCSVGSWTIEQTTQPLHAFYQQVRNLTRPTVIDARGCATINFSGTTNLVLRANVVFILNGMSTDTFNVTSQGGARQIFFLTPDAQPTIPGPQCPTGSGDFKVNVKGTFDENTTAMVYTPCTVSLNGGTKWRGQIYAKSITVSAGDGIIYSPMFIPGTNLEAPAGSPAIIKVGPMESSRNRSDLG
jgi:cytoskeletal protein CcmA (bactofilin family)